MSYLCEPGSSAPRRSLGPVWVVVFIIFCSGCTTASTQQASESARPPVPPPVSDHTLGPDGEDASAVRPRVTVEFEPEQGSLLSAEGVDESVRRQALRCYRLGLHNDRKLQGRLLYEMLVTSNGRVGGLEKISTTAPSTRLERCLEGALYRLRFDVPVQHRALLSRVYVRVQLYRESFDASQQPPNAAPR